MKNAKTYRFDSFITALFVKPYAVPELTKETFIRIQNNSFVNAPFLYTGKFGNLKTSTILYIEDTGYRYIRATYLEEFNELDIEIMY